MPRYWNTWVLTLIAWLVGAVLGACFEWHDLPTDATGDDYERFVGYLLGESLGLAALIAVISSVRNFLIEP